MQMLERRLTELGERLKRYRAEIYILEEQLQVLDDDASDANLRALVAETAFAQSEAREAQRHADALRKERDHLLHSIEGIRRDQDALLDQLAARVSTAEGRMAEER